MNELVAIQAVLTSIKAATDIAKILGESKTSLKDAETKYKLAELISALAEAKIELAQVQETLQTQAAQIRKLEEKSAFLRKMTYEAPYYWNIDGDARDGPYCQRCWDEKQLAVRLQSRSNGSWKCTSCGTFVTDRDHVSPSNSYEPAGDWVNARRR
jgi:hypothetical protein